MSAALDDLRFDDRDGRARLIAKLEALHQYAVRVERVNAYANVNLGNVQQRCTELLGARRALAWEVQELSEALFESDGAWTMRARVALVLATETAWRAP